MEEIIFSNKRLWKEKLRIIVRKFKTVILAILSILMAPIIYLIGFIRIHFDKIYVKNYHRRAVINKHVWQLISIYSFLVIIFSIICFIIKKVQNIEIVSTVLLFVLLALIPGIITLYLIIKKVLNVYYYLRGQYHINEKEYEATKQYIITKMPHLTKTNGDTGAGKDTLVSGEESVLINHFRAKTISQMEEIKEICYIIDFNKLDEDLFKNWELFKTNSKEKILAAFIGSSDSPGIATYSSCYIKKYYLKKRIITPEGLVQDYYNFKQDPYNYDTKYAYGVRVQRKHFLQLIMFEYIEWWMRINIEQNFLYSNQPKIEDVNLGIMAKIFSLHFLRSKSQTKIVKVGNSDKKEKKVEKVLFPFKDRIIVSETECDTWYSNRSGDVDKDMLDGGIRDTKAYNRHYFKDFYWFQIGQAASRTNILLRELEHGYQHVYSRTEVEGGGTLYLEYKLNRLSNKLAKIEKKCSSKLSPKKEQLMDDLNNLYLASSNEAYKKKMDKIYRKNKAKPYPPKYYDIKMKISDIKAEINRRKRDGYIKLIVSISKNPGHPTDYTVVNMSKIMEDPSRVPLSFVGEFVFKMEDCEKYDTHYMNALAEKRSQDTVIHHAEVMRWPEHMKMKKKEALLLGYPACNDMFDISEKEIDELRYGSKIDEYKICGR